MPLKKTQDLKLHQKFQQALPADSENSNSTRQVNGACYSYVEPTKVCAPTLISYSDELAEELGIGTDFMHSQEATKVFSGNQLIEGCKPYACCYGGHQFGHWADQLGDGRAINLGEIQTPSKDFQLLQLKGAGPTPYSRSADGLAVLRSSIREYLCSESMHYLGIPTTRALSLVSTGEHVPRDMFYDGNVQMEPGAIVCRVAPNFVRFGSFEILSSRQDLGNLKTLADYTITQFFPDLSALLELSPQQAYTEWFARVAEKTCDMIVHWMRVGFVHGVMNTDNMSISGLTIDYGPYGWLDNFDPTWTPNTTDATYRRYRYEQQPGIAQWNLFQLANAIYPLIQQVEPLQEIVKDFGQQYQAKWLQMMRGKLGLLTADNKDVALMAKLETVLHESQLDMTLFYRLLSELNVDAGVPDETFVKSVIDLSYLKSGLSDKTTSELSAWLQLYVDRIKRDQTSFSNKDWAAERLAKMHQSNPAFILRNYLAQQAIDSAYQGEFNEIDTLLKLAKSPYTELKGYEDYYTKRPSWAEQKAGCSMLSCSS